MKTATAISIPTAPVLPAIRHIFFTSGSMAGVPVSRRGLEIKAARTHVAHTAAMMAVGRPATPGTTRNFRAGSLQLRDVGQAAVSVSLGGRRLGGGHRTRRDAARVGDVLERAAPVVPGTAAGAGHR